MSQLTRYLSWFPLLLALTLLPGCGFQLRGVVDLPSSISPIQIQGLGEYDGLRIELSQMLHGNGIQVNKERASARSILQIRNHQSERRVLSVDGNAKVAEYELHETIQFSLIDTQGELLVTEQKVSVLRNYINTEDQVLGKQQEEEVLRQEMRRDLAGRVIRILQTQLH